MNEQFKQLAEQAGFSIGLNNYYWGGADGKSLEKFAELLIKECASLVVDDYVILEHFGVEE